MDETEFEIWANSLVDEREREFELAIADYATHKIDEGTCAQLENLLDSSDPRSDSVTFVAFCVLAKFYQRTLDHSKYKALLNKHEYRFDRNDHPFMDHMEIVQWLASGSAKDPGAKRYLKQAQKNIERLSGNYGAKNAFAEVVAKIYEDQDLLSDEDKKWIEEGMNAIDDALVSCDSYAKFYRAKGKLLSLQGKYDDAISYFDLAIDREDSSSIDYAMRIGDYRSQRLLAQQKKSLARYLEKMIDLEATTKGFEAQINKSIELIGLFAAIVAFTLGSLSFSATLAKVSFLGTAGLIIVLMGTLLIVYAGLGVVLRGFKKDNLSRTIVVAVLGLVSICIGVTLCILV